MNNEKNFLMDHWHSEGKGLESFKEEIADLAAHTHFISVMSDSQDGVENDGVYHCMEYDEEEGRLRALSVNGAEGRIDGRVASVRNINLDESLDSAAIMRELLRTTSLMIRFYSSTYFFSEKSYFTFAQRLGMDEAMQDASIERDIFISRLMRKNGKEWKLCVREMGEGKGRIRKVFAVFTGKYDEIPQSVIADIADDICNRRTEVFGQGELVQWSINHETTTAVIEFPEQAEAIRKTYGISGLTPAIRIITGDTGKASLTFQAIWKRGASYTVQDELTLRHQGKKVSKEGIEERVDEKLFPVFSKLPERLVELMDIDITDGSVPAARFAAENRAAVTGFIKMVSKKVRLVDAISKKNEMRVRELIEEELDYSEHYTAYDIIMIFMDLPERLGGLSPAYRKALEKACGRAPFIRIPEKAADELYLSA